MNIDLHKNVDEKFPDIRQWLCQKSEDKNFLLGILGEEKYINYLKQFQSTNKIITPQKFTHMLFSELIVKSINGSDEEKIFRQISDYHDAERIKHRKMVELLKLSNRNNYNKVINYIKLIGINNKTFLDKVPNAYFLAENTFKNFIEEVYEIFRIDSESYDNDEKMFKLILDTQSKYELILHNNYIEYLEEIEEYKNEDENEDENEDGDEDENRKIIQNGKAIQYDELIKLMREYDNKHCRICLGDYNANDQLLITNPCKHMFHKSCLEKWEKPTCPMCRTNIKIN